jgi:hypothetical protein
MSKELLKLLESIRHHSWKYIVTFEEAWFYLLIFLLIMNHESRINFAKSGRWICTTGEKTAPSPKMILIVIWITQGFNLPDILSKINKFNFKHHIVQILKSLPEFFAPYHDNSRRHFLIHVDSIRPHCDKTISQFVNHDSLRWTFHSFYSPYLAFSDFWFFAYSNGVLQESFFN